jgi:L-ascorbate metabolism protein UlaG (beta-lactamase superfamily)
MKIRLIRHATLWLEYAGAIFLIDPMFGDTAVNPPITNSGDERRNPLVPMPGTLDEWIAPDAVFITHLHRDHWDDAAAQVLPKSLIIFCQPGDKTTIGSSGFYNITEIHTSTVFRGVNIHRTGGQHGTGEIGLKMGQVSGFVLQAEGEPTLYIAGDTIWCEDVRSVLEAYKPDTTIVNAGGARFLIGDAITMDAEDVIALTRFALYTRVVAVHMDTINHCHITRDVLRSRLTAENLLDQVEIPQDGEWI